MSTFLLLFAPVVAAALSAAGIVLVAVMIPNPGERGHDWWVNTGQPAAQQHRFDALGLDRADLNNPEVIYGHDISPDVWAEAGRRLRDQTGRPSPQRAPDWSWPNHTPDSVTSFTIAPNGNLADRAALAEIPDSAPDGLCPVTDGTIWYADVPNRHCRRITDHDAIVEAVEADRGCFSCAVSPDGTLLITANVWDDKTFVSGRGVLFRTIANRQGNP